MIEGRLLGKLREYSDSGFDLRLRRVDTELFQRAIGQLGDDSALGHGFLFGDELMRYTQRDDDEDIDGDDGTILITQATVLITVRVAAKAARNRKATTATVAGRAARRKRRTGRTGKPARTRRTRRTRKTRRTARMLARARRRTRTVIGMLPRKRILVAVRRMPKTRRIRMHPRAKPRMTRRVQWPKEERVSRPKKELKSVSHLLILKMRILLSRMMRARPNVMRFSIISKMNLRMMTKENKTYLLPAKRPRKVRKLESTKMKMQHTNQGILDFKELTGTKQVLCTQTILCFEKKTLVSLHPDERSTPSPKK